MMACHRSNPRGKPFQMIVSFLPQPLLVNCQLFDDFIPRDQPKSVVSYRVGLGRRASAKPLEQRGMLALESLGELPQVVKAKPKTDPGTKITFGRDPERTC